MLPTLLFTFLAIPAFAAVPTPVLTEARSLLESMIAADTSNPPGAESQITSLLRPPLEAAGLEVRVFEPSPGRASLYARLKGGGKGKPILVMAHTDVVGAPRESWNTDPFKLTEKDGHLYGRGVLDDKGMGAVAVAAALHIARSKKPLQRDLILFLGADEESGGQHGIVWMLEHHPELFDVEVALNEGGGIGIEDGVITQAAVQLYEKLYMDVTLSAEGESGHSSMPTQNNAVVRLSRAVARVGELRFPMKLNAVTRAYFEGLAAGKHPLKDAFADVAKEDEEKRAAAEKTLARFPFYDAQLRTTCTPTVVKAGFRSNAIPGRAEAKVNCRLLPDATREETLAALRDAIDDPKIVLEAGEPGTPRRSPHEDPFFEAIKAVLGEMAPGAAAVPFMSAGATDSARLRARGVKAYGLVPFPITAEDKGRMHGDNERIPAGSLDFGVEFLVRLLRRYAGS